MNKISEDRLKVIASPEWKEVHYTEIESMAQELLTLHQQNAELHQEIREQIDAWETLKAEYDDAYDLIQSLRQQNADLSKSLMDLQSRELYDEVHALQAENAELIENCTGLAGYLLDYHTSYGESLIKRHVALMQRIKRKDE